MLIPEPFKPIRFQLIKVITVHLHHETNYLFQCMSRKIPMLQAYLNIPERPFKIFRVAYRFSPGRPCVVLEGSNLTWLQPKQVQQLLAQNLLVLVAKIKMRAHNKKIFQDQHMVDRDCGGCKIAVDYN